MPEGDHLTEWIQALVGNSARRVPKGSLSPKAVPLATSSRLSMPDTKPEKTRTTLSVPPAARSTLFGCHSSESTVLHEGGEEGKEKEEKGREKRRKGMSGYYLSMFFLMCLETHQLLSCSK